MQRFSLAAVAPAALVLAAVVAACSGAAPSATPAPTAAPTGTPVVTPTPAPTGTPAPAPSEAPSDAPEDGAIELDTAGGHVISVVVTDRGAGVVRAGSGTAGDGMSVRWGDASVKNLGPDTIQVTWVGFPQDETVGLVVEPEDGGVHFRFGQNAPYENTDALGADRVMVFTFAQPVSADDVTVEFTTADD